ncbi:MAG: hypothetical protein WD205_13085, partial [Rhodothermales bacterium]
MTWRHSANVDGGPGQRMVAHTRPLRTLAMLFGWAIAGALLLLSSVATGRTTDGHPGLTAWTVRADSDSAAASTVAIDSTDSTLADTTDSTLVDTTDFRRVEFYIPRWRRDSWTASPVQRTRRPFHPGLGGYWQHEVTLDSTSRQFTIREHVGGSEVRDPLTLDYETYRQRRLEADLARGWRSIVRQREQQRERRRNGGLGFNIEVPGGQESAFTTIFGEPSVDLRVNGQADITAGFDYRKSDQQVAVTGRSSQIDPDFKQDLRLGITGSIGDKLRVDVNWDTNNQFDFQNQLR